LSQEKKRYRQDFGGENLKKTLEDLGMDGGY
jgi:hypothetical protein